MNIINQPITTFNYYNTFKGKSVRITDDRIHNKKKNTAVVALAGLAIIGTVTVAAVLSKQSRKKALELAGLEPVNNFICKKDTGEKFTGSINRNISMFGLKKEVNNFEDGVLTEILNYGFNGKELDGYFYKNGNLLYYSGIPTGNSKIKYYPWYKYDSNGNVCMHADCKAEPKDSIFDHMRKLVQKES